MCWKWDNHLIMYIYICMCIYLYAHIHTHVNTYFSSLLYKRLICKIHYYKILEFTNSSKNVITNHQYPVFLKSFTNSRDYLLMGPNLENIISRSSSVVTGFNLHTNSTFSGGLISASGRSPT